MDAAPSEAERSAVDGFLGATGDRLGGRSRALRTRPPGRARRSRGARPAPPPAPGPSRSPGGRGVDQPGRAQLRVASGSRFRPPRPTASRRSTRCSASRSDPRTSCTSVTTSRAAGAGGLALCEELERDAGRKVPMPADGRWVRSPCLGMCEQAPAVFAQRAGRPEVAMGEATRATVDAIMAPDSTSCAPAGSGRRRRSRRRGASVCGSCGAPASSIRLRSTTTAPTAATRRSATAMELGARGHDPGGDRREAPRAWRSRVPHRGQVAGGHHAAGAARNT